MNIQEELDRLQAQLDAANAEIQSLQQQVRDRDLTICQARDASPVARPGFKRVLLLARAACLDISKVKDGWILSMGPSLQRKFKLLRQIWDLLVVGDWFLSDLFDEPVLTEEVIKQVPWDKLKFVSSLESDSRTW